MKKLKWFTTDKPLVDGWYWRSFPDEPDLPEVVLVKSSKWKGIVFDTWVRVFDTSIWAGPIPNRRSE